MNEVPIFDCITHPTLDMTWVNPKYNSYCDIELLVADLKKYNYCKAFAVGMKNIGSYEHQRFIDMVSEYEQLVPVAYCEDEAELDYIKQLGYKGIKIHPRFSNFNFTDEKIPSIIKRANELELLPMLCTYFSSRELNVRDNLRELAAMMNSIPEEKVVMLHSGVVNLLEFVNMFKIYPNVLFDLSFTISKYVNSSLDMDIRFLFESFDQRICIGSDHPEVQLKFLRERFEFFSKDISQIKKENIAYKNITKWLTY